MKYNKLGCLEKISQIGFGCWQLGGELQIGATPVSYGKTDEALARKAVRHAFDLGINFFDTADIYGLGKSERALEEEIGSNRDKVILCTKAGHVPDGVYGTIPDYSYHHLIASCERSLKRLKTDYLDVFLLHCTPPSKELEEPLKALTKLKNSGKTREFGISISNRFNLIPELIPNFPVIELYYNILLRDFEGYSKAINESNTGIIAASPLSRGLLSGKDYDSVVFLESDVRSKWKSDPKQIEWYSAQKLKVQKLKELESAFGIPLKNLAISYILSNGVSTVIPGIKSPDEADEIVKSLEFFPLSLERINKIRTLE